MPAITLQFTNMNNAEALSNLQMLPIDFNMGVDNVVVTGVAGKKIYVYRILFVVGGTTNLTFKDGVSTSLTGAMPFTSGGAVALDISNVPWYQTSNGNDFIIASSQSVQISGTVYFQQI